MIENKKHYLKHLFPTSNSSDLSIKTHTASKCLRHTKIKDWMFQEWKANHFCSFIRHNISGRISFPGLGREIFCNFVNKSFNILVSFVQTEWASLSCFLEQTNVIKIKWPLFLKHWMVVWPWTSFQIFRASFFKSIIGFSGLLWRGNKMLGLDLVVVAIHFISTNHVFINLQWFYILRV